MAQIQHFLCELRRCTCWCNIRLAKSRTPSNDANSSRAKSLGGLYLDSWWFLISSLHDHWTWFLFQVTQLNIGRKTPATLRQGLHPRHFDIVILARFQLQKRWGSLTNFWAVHPHVLSQISWFSQLLSYSCFAWAWRVLRQERARYLRFQCWSGTRSWGPRLGCTCASCDHGFLRPVHPLVMEPAGAAWSLVRTQSSSKI